MECQMSNVESELVSIFAEVMEMAPVRYTLGLNHAYESGCTCLRCRADNAIEKATDYRELGDGEPSPSRVEQCKNCGLQIGKQSWGQFAGVWIHVITQRPKCPTAGNASRRTDCVAEPLRSGAAQEDSPHPDDPACHGCGKKPMRRVYRCDECGAFTGCSKEEVSPPSPEPICPMCCKPVFTDRAEGDTRELKAALHKIVFAIKEFGQEMELASRAGFPFIPSAGLCRRIDEALESGERLLG
jgi:hypothetical protein